MARNREILSVELKQSQYQGALLGLAVGDALGAPLKFRQRGSAPAVKEMTTGGPLHLGVGTWTDDTSMALCLAASLLEKNGFDAFDQLTRYNKWRRDGYLSSIGMAIDLSSTMRAALLKFEETQALECGEKTREWADNDVISRLAPIPMLFAKEPNKAIDYSRASAKTTHGALQALDAATYMGAILTGILRGDPKDKVLSDLYNPFGDDWTDHSFCDEIAQLATGSFRADTPHAITGDGFVGETLEAALWAFYRSNDFETGAILAVNLGGDADTTGAVYGQLAGAYYGVNAIPKRWRDVIVQKDLIVALADRLWNAAKNR
ncbi:MAG: ADP-ribosylglycohydrolase family protein [Candidatus Kapabacteria bacterium]|jgi:ADP-ribosylglycohydrolase|nr:ADP-ribosylglycohydrolase family protein [Candidatus Kapabacteria bacterium]